MPAPVQPDPWMWRGSASQATIGLLTLGRPGAQRTPLCCTPCVPTAPGQGMGESYSQCCLESRRAGERALARVLGVPASWQGKCMTQPQQRGLSWGRRAGPPPRQPVSRTPCTPSRAQCHYSKGLVWSLGSHRPVGPGRQAVVTKLLPAIAQLYSSVPA